MVGYHTILYNAFQTALSYPNDANVYIRITQLGHFKMHLVPRTIIANILSRCDENQ